MCVYQQASCALFPPDYLIIEEKENKRNTKFHAPFFSQYFAIWCLKKKKKANFS